MLNKLVTPVSFIVGDWFETLAEKYLELEETHRQSAWEATHMFPIESDSSDDSAFFQAFGKNRRQRRSRYGAARQTFLKFVLQGIIGGHCDLDILLDPFFLHYPRPGERKERYSGYGFSSAPADLIAALRATDVAEPWRNQHRSNIEEHPRFQIERLRYKFVRVIDDE